MRVKQAAKRYNSCPECTEILHFNIQIPKKILGVSIPNEERDTHPHVQPLGASGASIPLMWSPKNAYIML